MFRTLFGQGLGLGLVDPGLGLGLVSSDLGLGLVGMVSFNITASGYVVAPLYMVTVGDQSQECLVVPTAVTSPRNVGGSANDTDELCTECDTVMVANF
jgi:hypothetical protein